MLVRVCMLCVGVFKKYSGTLMVVVVSGWLNLNLSELFSVLLLVMVRFFMLCLCVCVFHNFGSRICCVV